MRVNIPVKGRDAKAQDVGEFGVNRERLGGITVSGDSLAACNGFDAAPYHAHDFITYLGNLHSNKNVHVNETISTCR